MLAVRHPDVADAAATRDAIEPADHALPERPLPDCALPDRALPDRTLMVPVDGGRLYVRVTGDLAGPRAPLLMIHGGPGSSHASFIDALPLAADRALILYDQLDCGRSEGAMDPATWRVDRFVAEIDAILQALGVMRWHVLGHSWGGTLALEYAARRPAALAGLILSSPLVSTARWMEDAMALRATLPAESQAALVAGDVGSARHAAATRAFYDRFYLRRPRPAATVAYMAAMPRTFTRSLYETMWGVNEFACTGTLRDHDGTALLDTLDGARCLFVTGEHDEARPATVAGFAARAGARVAVMADAGHSTFNDNRADMLTLIGPWLERQDRA